MNIDVFTSVYCKSNGAKVIEGAIGINLMNSKKKILANRFDRFNPSACGEPEYLGVLWSLALASEHTSGQITCHFNNMILVAQLNGILGKRLDWPESWLRNTAQFERNFESVEFTHGSLDDRRMSAVEALAIDTLSYHSYRIFEQLTAGSEKEYSG